MASKARGPSKATKSKVALEKIIGNTTRHNNTLAKNHVTGEYAYAAGAYVVIVNPAITGPKQLQFLVSPKPKAVSCLAFSTNGKFLAVGESGYQPAVLVWDLQQRKIVAELKSHKFGVGCVAFSPSGKWIVSAGFERDQMLEVWDWREQKSYACSKLVGKVYAIDFAPDGSYFVTVGDKHFKFWEYVDSQDNIKRTEKMHKTQYVLEGRSAGVPEKLKDKVLNTCFIDIAVAANGYAYSVTKDGHLLQILLEERRIDKLVNLKVNFASGLSYTPDAVAIGCNDGVVRLFHPDTLAYISTMPKPPPYGQGLTKNSIFESSTLVPDVLALRLLSNVSQIVVFYADNSVITWSNKNGKEFAPVQTWKAHAGCIWDMVTMSNGQVVTASADNTIRFWDLSCEEFGSELVRTITTSSEPSELQLTALEKINVESLPSYEGSGVRSLAISPDETHLASGDRNGNVRVHELEDYSCIATFAAHDAEVLSIHYSYGLQGEPQFLASASRDRLIHVFERTGFDSEAYTLRQTLDDHSSTVVAVKFAFQGDTTRLISCSSDKALLFRNVNVTAPGEITITSYQRDMMTNSALDIEIDPESAQMIAVGTDKKVTSWDVGTGKRASSLFTAESDAKGCKQHKVDFDPSGQLAVTVSQDKLVRLYDLEQGTMIAKVGGHCDLVTHARITYNCERLVTVGVDGCLFVWKLAPDLADHLKQRFEKCKSKMPRELARTKINATPRVSTNASFAGAQSTIPLSRTIASLRHEVPLTALPKWAQCLKTGSTWNVEDYDNDKENSFTRPCRWLGRWATELESVGVQVYAALTGNANVPTSRRYSLDKTAPVLQKPSTQVEDAANFVVDNDETGKVTGQVMEESDPDTPDDDLNFSEDTPEFLTDDYDALHAKYASKEKKENRLSISAKFHSMPKTQAPMSTKKRGDGTPKKPIVAKESPAGTPTRIPPPPKISSPVSNDKGTPTRLLPPTKVDEVVEIITSRKVVLPEVETALNSTETQTAPKPLTKAEEEAAAKRSKWEQEVERSRQKLRDLGINVPTNSRLSMPSTAFSAIARLPPSATAAALAAVAKPAETPVAVPAPISTAPAEPVAETAPPSIDELAPTPVEAIAEDAVKESSPTPVSEQTTEPPLETTAVIQTELEEELTAVDAPVEEPLTEAPSEASETIVYQDVLSPENTDADYLLAQQEEFLGDLTIEEGAAHMVDLLGESGSAPLSPTRWQQTLEEELLNDEEVTVTDVLSNLKHLFDMSLHLYSISRSPEVRTQFVELFRHMQRSLEASVPPSPETFAQAALLEKYSEQLVQLVKQKLQQ